VVAANDNVRPKMAAKTGQLVVPAYPDTLPAKPSATNPARGSIGAFVMQFLQMIFKKAA
jgi:hypothetical protein